MASEDINQRYYRLLAVKSPALDAEAALLLASHDPEEAALGVKLVAEKSLKSCYAKIPELYNLWNSILADRDPQFKVRTAIVSTLGAQKIGPDHLLLHAASIHAPITDGKDPAAFMRMFAILWLTERKNPAAAVLAKNALESEPEPGMRQTMASLLSRADPNLAAPALRQKLGGESDMDVRAHYIVALLNAAGTSGSVEILAHINAASGEMLAKLAGVLTIARVPESFPLLEQSLKLRRDPQDRKILIATLAEIGGSKERKALIELIPVTSVEEAETIIREIGSYEDAELDLLQSTAQKTSRALGALAREVIAEAALQRQEWRESR